MSLHVLIADDSLPMRRLVCRFLDAVGAARADEAASGEETLRLWGEGGYDLVVVDWNMHDLFGMKLLEALRAKQPELPIIIMSTDADHDRIQAALLAGATEYLVKPFDVNARQRLLHFCQQERPNALPETVG